MARPAVLALLVLLLRQDPSIDRLIEGLSSDSVEERDEAEKALVERGKEAEPALRKAAEGKDAERAARAAGALRRIADRCEETDWLSRVRALPSALPEFRWKGTDREYSTGVLRTTIENDLLVFDDRIEGKEDQTPIYYHCRAVCAVDKHLTLRAFTAEKGKDGKVVASCDLEVRDGVLQHRSDGKVAAPKERRFGEHVTSWYAQLRLVGILPQREGFSLTLDVVTYSGAAGTTLGETLACKGEKEVTLDGKPQRVWVWDCNGVTFWVQDHRPRRMACGSSWEILFSDPKR